MDGLGIEPLSEVLSQGQASIMAGRVTLFFINSTSTAYFRALSVVH